MRGLKLKSLLFPLQAGIYLNAYWIMLKTFVYRTFCSQQNLFAVVCAIDIWIDPLLRYGVQNNM
jgi:hypothetical protein